jgi:amino acid permease
LPFFFLCAVVFIAMLIAGDSIVIAAPMLVVSIICIAVIVSGRNPRWLQSPLDRWEARRRAR